jgi:hypothetical protein
LSTRIDSDVTGVDPQAGSDARLIVAFGGGVPSNITVPATVAAVAGSTFFVPRATRDFSVLSPSVPLQAVAPSSAATAIAMKLRDITFP